MEELISKEKELEFKKIKDEVASCRKCPLYNTRNYPVIGEGSHQAKIVFVGEAPGAREDLTGHPFCGAAGKVLDELLASVGLKREEVYITNLLKCRPPQNRDPLPEEIKSCSPYLLRQINLIKPKLICALGRHSMKFLFEKYGIEGRLEPISKIHGNLYEIKSLFGSISLLPLYHPAVVTYHPSMKETLKKDFQILKKFK